MDINSLCVTVDMVMFSLRHLSYWLLIVCATIRHNLILFLAEAGSAFPKILCATWRINNAQQSGDILL